MVQKKNELPSKQLGKNITEFKQMMIYLICEVVDLGYHVVSGHTSKQRAEVELQKAINQARTQKIEDLKKINYTQEAAEKFCDSIEFFVLDTVEVE